MLNNGIIPSIDNMKTFEYFLASDYEYCFLIDIHISMLEKMVQEAHKLDKKIIVHIDLLKGISSDECGVEYLCQRLKVDGIISTRRKTVEAAKRCNKIGILRVFLIDSKSLKMGLELAKHLQPDYLEILPAIAYTIVDRIKKETSVSIIGGGLLDNMEAVRLALSSGFESVSLSDSNIWRNYPSSEKIN